MLRFSIRDVLWLTVVVGLVCAWWVDRSNLAWQRSQAFLTIGRLRDKLDEANPEWRTAGDPIAPSLPKTMRPEIGFALGAILFGVAVLLVMLIWHGRLHNSLLERKPKISN